MGDAYRGRLLLFAIYHRIEEELNIGAVNKRDTGLPRFKEGRGRKAL
jgi:hypothetical protein